MCRAVLTDISVVFRRRIVVPVPPSRSRGQCKCGTLVGNVRQCERSLLDPKVKLCRPQDLCNALEIDDVHNSDSVEI